jgi:hypothetical protein
MGAIKTVCAITIACGVNRRPQAREQEIDHEPDYDWRQAHQRVEDDDHGLAAGEARQRHHGAERHANERGERDRGQAHDQRQAHDGNQRRVGPQQQLQRRNVVRHDPYLAAARCCISRQNGQFSERIHIFAGIFI